jgi:toxin ParE1/3/4
MDFKIVWTDPALNDLQDLVSHIAQDSPAVAERVGNEILARIDLLMNHPFMGAVYRRSRQRDIREVLCRKYRIFYRVIDEDRRVEVLTVWHGARREPRITG